MLRFIDDLVGAIADLIKTVIIGFCYFFAGFMIVSVVLLLLISGVTWIIDAFV